MSFACQKDSYCRKFTTKVKSCDPAQLSTVINGKKQKISGYEIVLEDTILFPEGGGQPDDRGRINDMEVLRITRRGAEAVHFVQKPLDPGAEAELEVDWTRRWDHMQQHSAQHLVTAIADTTYGFPTTSWNLGETSSFIELDTANMSPEQMSQLENMVNERIRSSIPMYPTLYTGIDDPTLQEVRTRGLPDDHEGAVRVVTIEGIEANMCCGTHVSNLAHLQAVKLLAVEKGKKGKTNLVFLAGNRVLQYAEKTYNREKGLTGLIKGNPDQHVELVDKLQKNCKIAQKNSLTLLREMATIEAKMYINSSPREPILSLHRKEGDNEYMNIIVNDVTSSIPEALIFLTTGDEKGQGLFILSGKEDDISILGPKVAELLEGKGAGKRGRFQGKANKLSKKTEAEKLLHQHIASGES